MNCEWLENDYTINEHKYIEYSDVKSQLDCAVQCMSTRYATHAFYMTETLDDVLIHQHHLWDLGGGFG